MPDTHNFVSQHIPNQIPGMRRSRIYRCCNDPPVCRLPQRVMMTNETRVRLILSAPTSLENNRAGIGEPNQGILGSEFVKLYAWFSTYQ